MGGSNSIPEHPLQKDVLVDVQKAKDYVQMHPEATRGNPPAENHDWNEEIQRLKTCLRIADFSKFTLGNVTFQVTYSHLWLNGARFIYLGPTLDWGQMNNTFGESNNALVSKLYRYTQNRKPDGGVFVTLNNEATQILKVEELTIPSLTNGDFHTIEQEVATLERATAILNDFVRNIPNSSNDLTMTMKAWSCGTIHDVSRFYNTVASNKRIEEWARQSEDPAIQALMQRVIEVGIRLVVASGRMWNEEKSCLLPNDFNDTLRVHVKEGHTTRFELILPDTLEGFTNLVADAVRYDFNRIGQNMLGLDNMVTKDEIGQILLEVDEGHRSVVTSDHAMISLGDAQMFAHNYLTILLTQKGVDVQQNTITNLLQTAPMLLEHIVALVFLSCTNDHQAVLVTEKQGNGPDFRYNFIRA